MAPTAPTTDIKRLEAKRSVYLSRITEVYRSAVQAKTDKSILGQLQARYTDLKEHYDKFGKLHNEIIMEVSEDGDFKVQDKIRKDTDNYYYETISIYTSLFPQINTQGTSAPTVQSNAVSSIKLPQINLPIFKGDQKLWPSFYDLYKKLIHENPSLSDVEKLQYLFAYLEDEPLKLLGGIPITNNNYLIAYDKLVKRYQNKRLLASNAMHSIMSATLKNDTAKDLRSLLNCFSESLAALKALQFPTDEWDFILFILLLEKLDINTRTTFELKYSDIEIPTYANLYDFLESKCRALESLQQSNKPIKPNNFPTNNKFSQNFQNSKKLNSSFALYNKVSSGSTSSHIKCYLCKEPHTLSKCCKFLEKSATDRNTYVKQNKLCSNCLHHSHSVQNCTSTFRCRVCRNSHHSSLHISSQPSVPSSNVAIPSPLTTQHAQGENSSTSLTLCASEPLHQQAVHVGNASARRGTVLLATATVEIQDGNGVFQPIRALIDSGSQCHFLSEKCIRRLGLSRRHFVTSIFGLNQMSSITSNGLAQCIIRPRNNSKTLFSFEAVVVPQVCSDMPSFNLQYKDWKHLGGLNLADEKYFLSSPIDLLIGAELFTQILGQGRKVGQVGQPTAIETVFGWILLGKVDNILHSNFPSTFFINCDVPLDVSLCKFWEIEQVPSKTHLSPDDKKCEEIFKSTTSRNSTGRFIVSLPFKNSEPDLGDMYPQAFRRFSLLENRLLKNPTLYSAYSDFLKEFIETGQMSLVSPDSPKPPLSCYLPHHCVIKPESVSTKLRVVWDGSAKGPKGLSLNDTLLSGPKLQKDIFTLLLVFRLHSVVFIADIKQMFRQILVTPEHRNFQKILWRFSPDEPLSEWTLNTVTFGLNCSPYLAMRTLQELATREAATFPEASKLIMNQIYVDDLLGTCPSVSAALSVQKQLIDLLSLGGFQLKKWASNCSELLAAVPNSDRQMPLSFDKDEPHFLKVLGLQWQPFSDTFSYQCQLSDKICTKRTILSNIGRIFDPLGFLSPVLLSAKYLMQCLWKSNVDWDEPPPQNIVNDWLQTVAEIPELAKLTLPRRILSDNFRRCEMHGFCDGSNVGYGAAVYIRLEILDKISVFLICAKSRVAPLKTLTIPRLELVGAKLLSDLIQVVKDTYAEQITFDEIFAWCDSQVVLAWLASPACRWETFVANRVNYIQERVPYRSWNYIPSALNAADCASRGMSPSALLNHEMWWNGPSFLSLPRSQWYENGLLTPPVDDMDGIEGERKVILTTEITEPHFLETILKKYSSLVKVQRILSFCFRFAHNSKSPTHIIPGALTIDELHKSLMCLILFVQQSSFSDIISKITNNLMLPKPFRKLAVFLDQNGFLRVGGRLRNSDLSFSAKHPLLLPSSHRLTTLIIQFTHNAYCHPGLKTLHHLLLQQYWILSARKAIQKTLSDCFRCFRVRPKFYSPPLMGDLPSHRISHLKPFSHVAIDFCGPFFITLYKMRGAKVFKAYVCVFVCTTTKAIHLELTQELSTDSFVAAFRRFVARRGNVVACYTDNGTNFVGANNLLSEYAQQACEKLTVRWYFSPPSGPHFNGLAEAGVKMVKTHILRVVGDQRLTYEEFSTLLCQIESLLNSRPLCAQSADPNDLIPLTPGHFLTLEPLNSVVPEVDISEININRLSRWQLISRLHNDFWKRYFKEYVNTLQQRQKWCESGSKVKLNDLVLISNDNVPPLKWPLGRIVELHPGDDNQVRVATVKTAIGQYKRPVIKLCPLPLSG